MAGFNWAGLRARLEKPAETPKPLSTIHASKLVKVGGLYRIRENYETIWKMEAGEDGRSYIVRVGESGEEGTQERLLVSTGPSEENYAKAAHKVTAKGRCPVCTAFDDEDGKCECEPADNGDDEYTGPSRRDPDREDFHSDGANKSYRTLVAGLVHIVWECEGCNAPNITKEGNAYECDACHKKVSEVLSPHPKPQVYDRFSAMASFGEWVGERMTKEGITKINHNLIDLWRKEAWNDPCPKCDKMKSESSPNCPLGKEHGRMPHDAVRTVKAYKCPQCDDIVEDSAKGKHSKFCPGKKEAGKDNHDRNEDGSHAKECKWCDRLEKDQKTYTKDEKKEAKSGEDFLKEIEKKDEKKNPFYGAPLLPPQKKEKSKKDKD